MTNQLSHITVEVEMLAFQEGQLRPVDIPLSEVGPILTLSAILEATFKYGQNEIQPKRFCSVSVGDVIRLMNDRYSIEPFGFKKI